MTEFTWEEIIKDFEWFYNKKVDLSKKLNEKNQVEYISKPTNDLFIAFADGYMAGIKNMGPK